MLELISFQINFHLYFASVFCLAVSPRSFHPFQPANIRKIAAAQNRDRLQRTCLAEASRLVMQLLQKDL